ncbi:glycerol acyltransferase [Alloprevotella tannerae]|uniref:glycerol acyltransferase n=1 Tax=Alloprevotella tannerae TaxID=76122 RepID=UPI0025D7EB98|nr:glycerol acyltransferase [Alloprevotella tannerae]
MDGTIFKIDIDKVLRDKAGKKAGYIPRFMVSWLKKTIHEEEINSFLEEEGDRQGVPWLWDCLRYLGVELKVEGREHLPAPDDGKLYTFVSNHPLGGQDGVALGAVLGEHFDGRIKYLVNDILMNLHGLAPLCIPINTTGKKGRDFPKMVEAGFAGTDNIIMFPAGLCSRRQKDGQIRDLAWKKTFITKSVSSQRDVVPIFFSGSNSKFFYRLANICKRLHIKFNIAMLFLVDEMYKNRNKTFTIKIGKPIPWQTFDRSRSDQEWAAYVREKVYQL